ncbi:MAG: TatD family hydrolase [Candidatus Peribacteraceae bacterium]|jgi:TatD DNase family protein|nr:TatD family hydrolase [Candidatus Peribacteraceae bacterium]HCI04105.1 hypothetical protein [Candidatus Peribacteria bacterium]|tara:strand:- start:832 stop:1635 length:804 start_codon:yes stop_codon:yes gene_type:complete
MIDSHCHLADKKFRSDLDQVISRAKQSGVSPLITISDTLKEGQECIKICDKFDDVYCAVGVHPHASRNWGEGDDERLMKMVSSEKAVAIGEIGLDYYYDNSPRDVQRKVFEAQLQIAKDLDVPVVIHSRDAPNQSSAETDSGSGQAIDDLKKIIDEVDYERIVIHCCTEKWEDVSDLVGRGFILGFTGIATYAKSEHIRNVIKNCPLEQMMIETDSPYLAPEAQRGKRNEPAFVVEVAKLIAEIKGVEYEEVDRVTEKSTMDFYNIN